jgi:hypothetical protein
MIKPEFLDDEKLASISRDARLTFIGMWIHSDDYGVVKGNPTWLKNKIYPYEEIRLSDFQKWLTELEKLLCILPFETEGEKYFYIRTFTEHQTINRPSQQRNPEPPSNLLEDSLSTHGVLTDETETEVKEKQKQNARTRESYVFILPEDINQKTWDAFVEMRLQIKKPLTEWAKHLICLELDKMGQDKNAVLNKSITNNWQDVYPLDNGGGENGKQPSQPENPIDRYKRLNSL